MFWSSVPLLPLGTILLLLPATHLQGDDGWRGENIYSQCNWVVPAFSPLATSHTKHTRAFHCAKDMDGWSSSGWDPAAALLFTPLHNKLRTSCLLSFIEGDNTLCIWPLADWQHNVDWLIVAGVKQNFETRWIGWAGVNVPDEEGRASLTEALALKVFFFSPMPKSTGL